jgi:hypothetical protein
MQYPLVDFTRFESLADAGVWANRIKEGSFKVARFHKAAYETICSFVAKNYTEFSIKTIDNTTDCLYKVCRRGSGEEPIAEAPKVVASPVQVPPPAEVQVVVQVQNVAPPTKVAPVKKPVIRHVFPPLTRKKVEIEPMQEEPTKAKPTTAKVYKDGLAVVQSYRNILRKGGADAS